VYHSTAGSRVIEKKEEGLACLDSLLQEALREECADFMHPVHLIVYGLGLIRVSDFRFRFSGFGVRVCTVHLIVYELGFWVSDFRFWVSGFGFWI